MNKLGISIILGLALTTVLSPLNGQAFADRRVALVIGNAKYTNTITLPNVENDAPAVAAALSRLGFEVIEGNDLDRSSMNTKLKDFARALIGADVGLFFYAGHGMQVAGENYLLPVDASLKQESDLEFEAVKVDTVLKQMFRETKIKIVLLDACRDNPLAASLSRSMSPRSRSSGGASSGLGVIDTSAVGGTIIAFATAPGSVALDGQGSHSPFTQALLEHMETPGLDVDVMMKRVRGSVAKLTGERQQPWTNSSLNGDFSLAASGEQKTASLPAATDASAPAKEGNGIVRSQGDPLAQADAELWATADNSGRLTDYQGYLAAYPEGRYAVTAKRKIEQLEAKKTASLEPDTNAAPSAGTFASNETERELKLSSEEIRDLHTRLVLLGFPQGGIRSAFNKKSRHAISAWQSSEHLVPTGFLNRAQTNLIKSKSEKQYADWISQNRPNLVAAEQNDDQGASSSGRRERHRGNGGGGDQGAAVAGAIARGLLRGGIGF